MAREGSAATNKGHGASTEQMLISASQLLMKKHCFGYDFVMLVACTYSTHLDVLFSSFFVVVVSSPIFPLISGHVRDPPCIVNQSPMSSNFTKTTRVIVIQVRTSPCQRSWYRNSSSSEFARLHVHWRKNWRSHHVT